MFEVQEKATHCPFVLVKGGGDVASGVIYRLFKAGFKVLFTEVERPLAVRRLVSFCEAIYKGRWEVEGITAQRIQDINEAKKIWENGKVPGLVDPQARAVRLLKPMVLVDATLAKVNLGTHISQAPLTIGIGPGFEAGVDVHVVVETMRGHDVGRVITKGSALPNTGFPEPVMGYTVERVLRASKDGVWIPKREIGDLIKEGEIVGFIGDSPVITRIGGVIRGLLYPGLHVKKGLKIGDVDPRGDRDACFKISDKALAVGGGVLEAIFSWIQSVKRLNPLEGLKI